MRGRLGGEQYPITLHPFYAVTASALVVFYSAAAYAATRSWLTPIVGCLAFWLDDTVAYDPPSDYVASA